jgi:hypothetical protein
MAVPATSSATIGDGATTTLQNVAITNNSGAACNLIVTRYPVPPGGLPADSGEAGVHWQISTDCATYNFDLVFNYTDVDLARSNGITEANLAAYRSTDGNSYSQVGGTVNTSANTVTVSGVTQLSWWTLGNSGTLAVTLTNFSAAQEDDAVLVTWETASELENRGFNLYRGVDPAGPDRQLNATLIPSQSQGSPSGFIYTWEDRADLQLGTTYFYWVEDVDISGATTIHGPVSVGFAPLAVTLAGFSAVQQGDTILATWETASELDNLGFNLYRGVDPTGPDRQLNAALIPSQSPGSSGGYAYTWEDRADLLPGVTYFYWLEDVDIHGATTMHGPVSVTMQTPTAVTLSRFQAGAADTPGPAVGVLLMALLTLVVTVPLARLLALRQPKDE